MNLTLIGMPTSGKSRYGKRVAEKLGLTLIDPDKLIEAEYGKALQEVLDELGDEAFLKKEADVTLAVSGGKDGLLIATGGSIIYTDAAMERLTEQSTIVYLSISLPEVEARIGRKPPRAIVGLGAKTIPELYAERVPLYERWAEAIVDVEQDEEAITRAIIACCASS